MFSTNPVHRTNNLVLRFIANNIFSPIAHYFLSKSLRVYFKYEQSYEDMEDFRAPFPDSLRISLYSKLYNILDKPYGRWGTYYVLKLEDITDSESTGNEDA